MPGVEHVAGWLTLEEEREIEARVEVTRAAVMASAASAIDDVTAARSKLVALQSAMEESERESLESRERAKRRHEALRQALEEEERENGVQVRRVVFATRRDCDSSRIVMVIRVLLSINVVIIHVYAERIFSRDGEGHENTRHTCAARRGRLPSSTRIYVDGVFSRDG